MFKFDSDYYYLVSFKRVLEDVSYEVIGYSPNLPERGERFNVICCTNQANKNGATLIKTSPVEDLIYFDDKPNYTTVVTSTGSYDLWVLEKGIVQNDIVELQGGNPVEIDGPDKINSKYVN